MIGVCRYMASIMLYWKCPHCAGIAVMDDYYKIGDQYLWCERCGYSYQKEQDYYDSQKNEIFFKETEQIGYGMFKIVNKEGKSQLVPIHSILTDERIEAYKKEMEREDIDKEKCYLVSYKDNELKVLFGEVPELYFYTYDEYKKLHPDFDPYYLQGVTISF